MKRRYVKAFDLLIIIVIIALLLFQISGSLSLPPLAGREHEQRFSFPASLQYIEEEAFDGVAITVVSFGNELRYIGERAFAGADRLEKAYIPPSVEYIADLSFPNSIMIYGAEDSYAQTWAEKNGFTFVVKDIWNAVQSTNGIRAETLLSLFWVIAPVDEKALFRWKKRVDLFVKSMRPKDRPEMYPIQYRFP